MTRAEEIAALHDIIVTHTPREKSIRLARIRAELKPLGYSIVDSRYLAGLLVQAKRRLENA